MSRQALGNAAAGLLFFGIAIWNFSADPSGGAGAVFLIFAGVFLGLAYTGRDAGARP